VTGALNKQCENTMYRAGDLPKTGKREQVLIWVLWPVWDQGWSLCICYCCENLTNPHPQNVYRTILRWRLETIGSSWPTTKFEQK
jgi:hypothetical protein